LSFIYQLQYRLQEAIIYQVSDDFMDITSTIKTLCETSLTSTSHEKMIIDLHRNMIILYSLGESNRQEQFQSAVQDFTSHSSTLTQTARLAANGTSCRSKSTIEAINITASQVR
jgi:hypothetical protein